VVAERLRDDLESSGATVMSNNKGIDQSKRARKLRHLQELIAALDRRVPHVERLGEIEIARQGHALRENALKRIAELEASVETSQTQAPQES
jgi:hypothetical protein